MTKKIDFERIFKTMKRYLKNFFKILPNVVVPLLIMVLIENCFGTNHSVIGIILIFVCMLKVNELKSVKTYLQMSFMLIIIAILASIASLNIYTSIVLNLVIPFIIIYLTTAKQKESNYFLYGYEFIMFQSYPISISEISLRIVAIIVALAPGYIYMKIYNRKEKIDENIVSDFDLVVYNLKHIKKELNFKVPRIRFAVRTAFILWITCVFMDLVTDRTIRSYWLPLITYSCLEIDNQKQKSKLLAQIGGATLGIGVFIIIFHWIPTHALLVFMAIAFTALFAVDNQYLKKAIGTILGMSFVLPTLGEFGAILLRYVYVMAAIFIIAIFEYLRVVVRKIERQIAQ